MSRSELRCDAERALTIEAEAIRKAAAGALGSDFEIERISLPPQKCGKLLARSPELGERVQWLTPKEKTGRVWLVDYHRHLACMHVDTVDGIDQALPLESETVAWTALRPCNGEPIR